MKFGIHAYAWCSEWSNDTLDIIDKVKNLGLDFIEIPLMCLNTFDPVAVKQRLQKVGLGVCTSTVLLDGYDITSRDAKVRRNGVEYLKSCIRATKEVGADRLSGVLYAEYCKPSMRRPTEEDWKYSAECLKEAAKYAAEYNILLGLEPVTRYETSLINNCGQALRLIDKIGEPNVKIHLDTYHMNVEEKSFYEATKMAGDKLMHYHFSENDRGIPGTGHVDWDGIFRALAEIGYDGYAGMETFMENTDNMSTWVWHPLAKDGETLVREGIAFFRKMQQKYGLK